jgi:hypothetical protein
LKKELIRRHALLEFQNEGSLRDNVCGLAIEKLPCPAGRNVDHATVFKFESDAVNRHGFSFPLREMSGSANQIFAPNNTRNSREGAVAISKDEIG